MQELWDRAVPVGEAGAGPGGGPGPPGAAGGVMGGAQRRAERRPLGKESLYET